MGAFQNYGLAFVIMIFGVTMILNFSGGIFASYNADVDNDALKEVKKKAEATGPDIEGQQNRTASISPDESAFLSPQGFGIIGDILSSAANMVDLVGVFVGELGLPKAITGLIVGVVSFRLIIEALSALFGWEL